MTETLRRGDPWIWLTGGALAASLLMVVGLLILILARGLGFFWPASLVEVELADGSRQLGVERNRDENPAAAPGDGGFRVQLQVGNRDVYAADFRWIDEDKIVKTSHPAHAVTIERREWGNFYGFVRTLFDGDRLVASGPEAWAELQARLPETHALVDQVAELRGTEIIAARTALESARKTLQRLEQNGGSASELDGARQRERDLAARHRQLRADLDELVEELERNWVGVTTVQGTERKIALETIVRVFRPNAMSGPAKVRMYVAKLWEFVSDDPRESNTEGGVFPALFGTVLMVLIMSIAVVPLGVLAALYLREYATQGVIVSTVRIAVNNLAGVPSIVFGVFGLGFFVYFVGGSLDALLFAERLPTPTFGTGGILWASLTLALLTVPVVVVATEEALSAVPREYREGSLALGATKFETLWRVVLPSALPGILTGLILAMARGAGEVAPLMITGVVKLAPSLPLDASWPFLHLDRKFMHLGFHIYDVGFQSPNVEAAKPMVYATTLLLVGMVVALNLSAILLRNRLRRRLAGGAF